MSKQLYIDLSPIERKVNRDLLQMIANFINDNHETRDQFLREFAYALRTAVIETTRKTPAELFLGGNYPVTKIGDGVRWNKIYETHSISSATKKVSAKLKPKFEGPYRVLRVQTKNFANLEDRKENNG
ncbi:hypothetical protein TNCV_4075521 [Trichonephila clavipes]|nr:hypothetical protein TNCV_4075521 [Trichonephila clavipes]